MQKAFSIFLFITFCSIQAFSQDTYQSRELNAELNNPKPGLWQWKYSIEDQLGSELIVSGKDVSIFVNNKLLGITDSDTLRLDRLGSIEVMLSFTSKYDLRAVLRTPVSDSIKASIPTFRSNKGFINYVSFFVSLSLIFLTVLKWTMGKGLNEFLRVDRMFSLRNSDENIIRNKFLSSSNLLYALFFSLVASGGIVCYLFLCEEGVKTFSDFIIEWMYFWGLFIVFLLVKWAIITFVSYAFNFNSFLQIHLVNYLRISAFFAIFWMIILLIFIWWFPELFNERVIYYGIISTAVIRMLVLYFKLNNSERYLPFHLFSYLCGTEIIPFFGIVYFTSGF